MYTRKFDLKEKAETKNSSALFWMRGIGPAINLMGGDFFIFLFNHRNSSGMSSQSGTDKYPNGGHPKF